MFDRRPKPVSRLRTTYLQHCILVVALLFVTQAQLGFARTITVGVADEGFDGEGYWVGLFQHPFTAQSTPKHWQQSESAETTLQISDQEDLVLVALQKGSVPLYQRIKPGTKELDVYLRFRKGKSLQGEVLSADGFPIEDAVISFQHLEVLQSHQLPDESIAEWQTDRRGKFLISGLQTGTYTIQITPRVGLPEESQELRLEEEGPEITIEDLQLQNVYFISGKVVNEENEYIDGAEVIATEWDEGLTSIQTSTNETGSFRIGPFLKDESIWIEAQESDDRFSEVQKVISGRTDLKLTIRKLLVLKGTVVERETGNLVKEFTVSALSGLDSTRMARWTNEYTFDGSKGHFSVEVDWRITHVIVDAPGFDFRFISVRFTNEKVHDFGTIELDRGRVVNGTIVDAITGNPVVGAEVRRTEWDQPDDEFAVYTYERRESTTADEQGKFTLSPLPIEEVTIEVSAEGYFHSETSLNEDQEFLEIELRKESHPTIRGRVQSIVGSPLKAELVLRNIRLGTTRIQATNLDGTFEILADDGIYELQARKSGFEDSNTETIVVEDQLLVTGVLLTINTSGNSILGSVTGLMEKESLVVRVYDSLSDSIREAYLYGNESYSFGGVAAGEYQVEGETSLNRKISTQVAIEGNDASVIVDIAFDGTSNLSGIVTAGGKPVDNVRVWAEPRTEGNIRGESKSEEDGSYLIEYLEDGEYDIHTDRGLSFEVVITSETYFDIEVGKLTFAGTVVSKLPTQDMIVVLKSDSEEQIYATSTVDSEGTFRIDGLTAGSYSIRVTKSGRVRPRHAKTTYSLSLDHSLEDYLIELESD